MCVFVCDMHSNPGHKILIRHLGSASGRPEYRRVDGRLRIPPTKTQQMSKAGDCGIYFCFFRKAK